MFRASYFQRAGTCATTAGNSTMAKPASIKIRLNSTADTGFFYVTKKNARTMTEKMVAQQIRPRRAQARRVQAKARSSKIWPNA
jgi:large subunit ribosomal protein L33